jgi:hypothetical protein
MKSYTLQTTIALLIMLLGCTLADTEAETQERRTLRIPPRASLDSSLSAWGLLPLNFAQHDGTKSATDRAAGVGKGKQGSKKGSKAPGGTKIKAVKSKTKGKGKGKACPKSRKSEKSKSKEKSKGKGKGSKKSSPPSSSFSPSAGPSASQMPSDSQSPSDTPSDSLRPSGSWCLEDEHPTVSPGPSSSTVPSLEPSVSQQPSVSAAPSSSSNPSNSPSVSAAPSGTPGITAGSTALGVATDNGATSAGVTGGSSRGEAFSTCFVHLVVYNDNENEINEVDGDGTADATVGTTVTIEWPQNLDSTRAYTAVVEFQVTGSPTKEMIAQGLTDTINKPIVLDLVDCNRMAQDEGMEMFTNADQRHLQVSDGTLAVLDNWVCVDPISTDETSEMTVTCNTQGHYDGALTADEFDDKFNKLLTQWPQLMDNVHDWYPKQAVTVTTNIEEFVPSSVIDSDLSKKGPGVRAGPFIGAATGMLAVLLLLVLFVRRRNRYNDEEVSHLKLDEDDTYFNGSDGSGGHQHEYNTRDIHIVGEGDSVISHWTGYTGRKEEQYEVSYNRDGLMRGRSQDVHQCSSATCDICDRDPLSGVSFIKTGTASMPDRAPSLPSDASREYIAEDTVQL